MSPHHKNDIEALECVQGRGIELLKELRVFSLERRRVRSDLMILYNYLKGGYSEVGVSFFFEVTIDRTIQNGLNLCQGRFRWNRREYFFPKKVVKYWNRLLREFVQLTLWEMYKKMCRCGGRCDVV